VANYRRACLLAAAVLIGLAGCGSAQQPSDGPRTTAAGLSERPSTGNVHLTDYAINTDGPDSTVIITGAIGDYGAGHAVKPDGSVDSEHTGQLKLTLQHGYR
jgi:hypothetical protein